MRIVSAAMLLSVVLSFGEPALAQQTQTQVTMSGGVATDQRGVRSSAVSIAPTLTLLPSDGIALQLGASATRFATKIWSIAGATTLSARRPLGQHAALTLSAAGSLSRLASGAAGTFLLGDITPALEVMAGPLTLFGGARAAAGRATQPDVAPASPLLPGGPRAAPDAVTTTTRVAPLVGAMVRFSGSAGTLQLGARVEPADGAALDASVSLPLASGVSIDIGAGRYPTNHLLDIPGGAYATAGVSLRFAGQRPASSLPKPVGVRAPRSGRTRLSIRAADARRVEVAGDFTEWKFVAATRAANGVWYADLPIPPGQYRYAFRIDGSEWRVPAEATAVDDGFGGRSAWLTVPGHSSSR